MAAMCSLGHGIVAIAYRDAEELQAVRRHTTLSKLLNIAAGNVDFTNAGNFLELSLDVLGIFTECKSVIGPRQRNIPDPVSRRAKSVSQLDPWRLQKYLAWLHRLCLLKGGQRVDSDEN